MNTLDALATGLRGAHIAAGAVGLVSMVVPLAAKKGGVAHRRFGMIYVVAMFVAAAGAVAIAPVRMLQRAPSHWHAPIFLAFLAMMSSASGFYGVRVLKQKRREGPLPAGFDLGVPVLLAASAAALLLYGLASRYVLAVIFAPLGMLVASRQWRTLRSAPSEPRWWLSEHLGAMMISCIGTVTAVLVVNVGRFAPAAAGPLVWVAPTIVGVGLTYRWRKRLGFRS